MNEHEKNAVDVTFPSIQGLTLSPENEAKLSRVQSSINALAREAGGSGGGRGTGSHGPAMLNVYEVDKEFVNEKLIPKLESLGVLDEVVVTFDDGKQEEQIHPPVS